MVSKYLMGKAVAMIHTFSCRIFSLIKRRLLKGHRLCEARSGGAGYVAAGQRIKGGVLPSLYLHSVGQGKMWSTNWDRFFPQGESHSNRFWSKRNPLIRRCTTSACGNFVDRGWRAKVSLAAAVATLRILNIETTRTLIVTISLVGIHIYQLFKNSFYTRSQSELLNIRHYRSIQKRGQLINHSCLRHQNIGWVYVADKS